MNPKISILCLAMLFSIALSAHAMNSPLQQTKAFVAAMKSVKTEGELSYPTIDKFINYDQLTLETIKPHLNAFTAKQVTTFQTLLKKLIRLISYPQSGDFYHDAIYTYQTPVVKNNQAFVVMDVVFEEEDLEMTLEYHWQKNADNDWQLVDLSFDEDSLVKDYQNQFARIITKEGTSGLIKRLKDKVIEIEKAS